jgi:cell division protein FtsI/penicillin-binding protein 2
MTSILIIRITLTLVLIASLPGTGGKVWSQRQASPIPSSCSAEISAGVICEAANQRALEIMKAGNFEAFTVVQNVHTGALIAFAASQPEKLDVNSQVLPLSVVKLLLAASWWDNAQPNTQFDSYRGATDTRKPKERMVTIHEMLVGGSDNAGRLAARALRKSVGTDTVLRDLNRYGFGNGTDFQPVGGFWKELAGQYENRLTLMPGLVLLNNSTSDTTWADTLSLGETNFKVTGLQISRFLQAIGNNGVMLQPVSRDRASGKYSGGGAIRVMKADTARQLQRAMRDTVQRGTARSIANALADSGWTMGGKTGTGPGPAPIGPQSDGWFAGLVFDPQGHAQFTVATFVRHGGTGGGNAARISAELARHLIGSASAH